MIHCEEILRLHSLGSSNSRIAESCGCAPRAVISTVQRAQENGIVYKDIRMLGESGVDGKLYPSTSMGRQFPILCCGYQKTKTSRPQANPKESTCRLPQKKFRASIYATVKACTDTLEATKPDEMELLSPFLLDGNPIPAL